jgi:hypothetical protein
MARSMAASGYRCAGPASGCHSHQLPIKPQRRRTGWLRLSRARRRMHIFVADEHPRQRQAAVRGAHEKSKPYGFSSRRDGARARGPCPTSASPARRKRTRRFATGARQLLRRQTVPHLRRKAPQPLAACRRAAIISDGGAAFHVFGCPFDGRCRVTSLTSRGERPCGHVLPF